MVRLQTVPGGQVAQQPPPLRWAVAAVAATATATTASATAPERAAQPAAEARSPAARRAWARVRVWRMQSTPDPASIGAVLSFLLNIVWAIFGGGIITALQYALAGLVCCLTIVGIPFGLQCFKLAGLALAPFGKDFATVRTGPVNFGLNVVWVVCAGIWIFLTHVALGLTAAVTIIGIPFAFQHLKLAMLSLWPFGAIIRQAR